MLWFWKRRGSSTQSTPDTNPPEKPRQNALSLIALEPRMVFDAAHHAAADHAHADIHMPSAAHPEAAAAFTALTAAADHHVPAAVKPQADTKPIRPSISMNRLLPTWLNRNRLHRDSVCGYRIAYKLSDPILRSTSWMHKDGVDQMAKILKGRHDISAIHILSHGGEANLYLGTADLNASR